MTVGASVVGFVVPATPVLQFVAFAVSILVGLVTAYVQIRNLLRDK